MGFISFIREGCGRVDHGKLTKYEKSSSGISHKLLDSSLNYLLSDRT
jgi:hypothetical protein